MNKKLTIFLLFLLMIGIANALDECKGTMNQNELPCNLLLSVNTTSTPCTTLSVGVYNNATLLYKETMGTLNTFKCNATFNQTPFGTYTFQYGTGDTGSIVVEIDQFQQYYLYVAAILVFFILVGVGYWKEEGIFVMIAGMLAAVIGINIFINGFPNLTNTFLRNGITMAIWGIGAYLIVAPATEVLEDLV